MFKNIACRGSVGVVIVVLLFVMAPLPGYSQSQDKSHPAKSFADLGVVGPDAVKLEVWTNQPPDHRFKTGDRVIIHLRADQDCYVAVVNVSRAGNVAVLFPNRMSPDNALKGGKEYTLFGDDSETKLIMGKGLKEARTIFYVAAQPFSLEPLKIPDGKLIMRWSAGDKNIGLLLDKLRQVAKTKGYNRVALSIGGSDEVEELRLMGPRAPKAAPAPYKSDSEVPETVTGTQGVKPETGR
jgi:hypothetical protein